MIQILITAILKAYLFSSSPTFLLKSVEMSYGMKNEVNSSTENGKGCLTHRIFKVHLKSTQDYCKAPLSSLGRTSPHFHTRITPLPTLAGSLKEKDH